MRDEDGKEIWEGYCIDFVKKLSEEMQFDYELVIPEDEEFGKKLPNGEWSGVIGDLAKGVSLIFKMICLHFKSTKLHVFFSRLISTLTFVPSSAIEYKGGNRFSIIVKFSPSTLLRSDYFLYLYFVLLYTLSYISLQVYKSIQYE